jgi:quercetin dioxygenase-like cupin family protein
MNEPALDQDALELAALYALSALTPSEMEEVERDWRERPAFWAEVRSLRDAAAGLAASGPRQKPRRDLWPAIRARVAAPAPHPAEAGRPEARATQVWKDWRSMPATDSCVRTAQEGDFEPTDIEGISVRRLFVDDENDRVTMLVRMAPGTAYPAHVHGGVEECFVLAGDLAVGAGTTLRSGDYQRMDEGSQHPVQATAGGCLLLIASSRHDELLE